ncbi:MAG TPA: DUF6580 family putative transport protein [Gemmataceae bacterium]|jgi:hypothetical protein
MSTENPKNEGGLAQTCVAGMAIAAGLARLLRYPMNFTPVGAIALFGGARLRSWWAYGIPLAVMAVSDLLLWAIYGHWNFNLLQYAFNPWVYGCFLLTVLWGRLFLRKGGAGRIAAVSVLVSVQFFLVTNFGAWWALSNPWTMADGTVMAALYTRDLSGLIACYLAAIPFTNPNAAPLGFLGNQLAGDLFYTGILFGAYAWLRSGVLVPRRLRALNAARTT